jgi:hypothetical protein
MDELPAPRDANGRYAAGNPGGPGRSKGKGYELQRAAQDAVTPEHVAGIMRKAVLLALQGNLAAMKFVLDRTCGRPPEASQTPLDFALPNLRTATGCANAIDRLVEGISAGTIDLHSAKVMLDLIQCRMKAIELGEFEARLAELEKQAGTVELPGRR